MREITKEHLQKYRQHLLEEEKSVATIEKYLHDSRFLFLIEMMIY